MERLSGAITGSTTCLAEVKENMNNRRPLQLTLLPQVGPKGSSKTGVAGLVTIFQTAFETIHCQDGPG